MPSCVHSALGRAGGRLGGRALGRAGSHGQVAVVCHAASHALIPACGGVAMPLTVCAGIDRLVSVLVLVLGSPCTVAVRDVRELYS